MPAQLQQRVTHNAARLKRRRKGGRIESLIALEHLTNGWNKSEEPDRPGARQPYTCVNL